MEEKLLLTKAALVWVNEYYEKEDYILLKIYRKNLSESYDVLIDKVDFKLVSQGQWYVYINRKNTHLKELIEILWTVHKNNKKTTYEIYQWILGTKHKNITIDHKNMDRLDNRRCNLRFATSQENRLNQVSTGWHYNKHDNVYVGNIYYKNKGFYLGKYNTKEEAEIMYLKACLLINYSDISYYHKSRIKQLKISMSDEDYKNIYLSRLIEYIQHGTIKDFSNKYIYHKNEAIMSNNSGLGYNYDKQTGKYLVRIRVKDKDINIGRYDTEDEANSIYLKACIISEKDKISPRIATRITENNIEITEDDYNNKYLKKIYNYINNIDEFIENGKFNYTYDDNMDIIIKLVNDGYSWHEIAKYLKSNIKGLEGAKGETVRKKYLKYINK